MKESSPYVITISRMLGSGGLIIGKQLAEKLKIACFDKEILFKAAEEFGVSETDLRERDEKTASIWELFLKSGILENPDMNTEPKLSLPTDRQLYETESEIIRNIAYKRSAVIIGRGGSYTLRDHPRHISVFLHCDADLRIQRMQEIMQLTEKDARKMIKANDSERSHYHQLFTGSDWTDARHYSICLDTGKIEFNECIELILKYVERYCR